MPSWQGTLARCRSELAQTRARLQEAELRLETAREREEIGARTYSALAERSRPQLALCPKCRQPVRGADMLVSGRCPKCNTALTSLLVPAPRAGLDSNEYLALLGALGVLVGLAPPALVRAPLEEARGEGQRRERELTIGICPKRWRTATRVPSIARAVAISRAAEGSAQHHPNAEFTKRSRTSRYLAYTAGPKLMSWGISRIETGEFRRSP